MERTGRGAVDAARHFFPGVSPEQQARIESRFRKWRHRAGSEPATPPPAQHPGAAPPAPSATRPPPRTDIARMTALDRLEWQIAELGADLDQARTTGDLRAVAALDNRLSQVGQDLDRARSAASRLVKLDRTAAAVATELERKSKAIALRAEMQRRAAARSRALAERERDL
jgi:hypothetical protein